MQANEPGWYPDPDGGRQVRFWDGDAWTEYVQPFAPVLVDLAGSDTALTDYPYLEDADLRATHEPRIVTTWEEDVPLVVATAPRRKRSALTWWIAGASVVLLVVVIALVASRRSGESVLSIPSPSSTVTASETVEVGAPVTLDVPAAGLALLTLSVPTDGTYFVEGTSQADIAMVIDEGGTTPWTSDDRGSDLVTVVGGSWQDPGMFVYLTAGEHDVAITEHSGLAASATVTLYEASTTDVVVGEPMTLTVPDGEYAVLRLQLDAESPLIVDVRADDISFDPRLVTFESGRSVLTDDRSPNEAATLGGTEYDPYLSSTFPAGTSYLVVDEWGLRGVTLTVSITPPS